MKRNRKLQVLIAVLLVFTVINVILLYIDDDGRVPRKQYLKDWDTVTSQDIMETLEVPAMITAQEEVPVFLNETEGSLSEILVKEGERVAVGDPLFSYQTADYQQTAVALEAAIVSLEQQQLAIQSAMDTIEVYQPEESDSLSVFDFSESAGIAEQGDQEPLLTEEQLDALTQASEEQTAYLQEQYLVELEKELAETEAQSEAKAAELDNLEANGEFVTVMSPQAGTVTEIAYTSEKPVITLKSEEIVLTGTLTEAERKQVEEGMRVEGSVTGLNAPLEGTIETLSEAAANTDPQTESSYDFRAALDVQETDEAILPGYHADANIVLAELENTPALETSLVENSAVWVMQSGKLHERKVSTGAAEGSLIALTDGVEAGTAVPAYRSDFYHNAVFITPIKAERISWTNVKENYSSYDLLLGLLDR